MLSCGFWDVVLEGLSDRRATDAWRTKIPSDGDGFWLRELSEISDSFDLIMGEIWIWIWS